MLKTTIIICFAIFGGYLVGRLQSPHSAESLEKETETIKSSPLKEAVAERTIATEMKPAQKLPREYRPRVEKKISKDYIKSRMKRLKQFSPEEFAEAEKQANEIVTE